MFKDLTEDGRCSDEKQSEEEEEDGDQGEEEGEGVERKSDAGEAGGGGRGLCSKPRHQRGEVVDSRRL